MCMLTGPHWQFQGWQIKALAQQVVAVGGLLVVKLTFKVLPHGHVLGATVVVGVIVEPTWVAKVRNHLSRKVYTQLRCKCSFYHGIATCGTLQWQMSLSDQYRLRSGRSNTCKRCPGRNIGTTQ